MARPSTNVKARQQFADWLHDQLRQRGWTQGQLIAESGLSNRDRLSSAAVSRYSTGKMLPDISSSKKIARALGLPLDLVLQKAGLIDSHPTGDTDWIQRAIDDLAYAVEADQLSKEGQKAIVAQIYREQRLRQLEHETSAASADIPTPTS